MEENNTDLEVNVSEQEAESLEHHSENDASQDEEGGSRPSISSQDEEDSSNVAEESTSDVQDVPDKKTNIPQWAIDNPEKWGKYKARLKEKEYENKLKQQQEEFERRLVDRASQPNNDDKKVNENIFYDPETGMQFDVTTPEGEILANDIIAKETRNKFKHKLAYQQYTNRQNQQEMMLSEKIEEAKFKYNDFEDVVVNNGKKFTKTMIDIAALMTDNNPSSKVNGSDFLYFLGKNPNELKRIGNMNMYDQYQALFKHAIDFSSHSPRMSKAPEPVKQLRNSVVQESANSSNEYAKSVIRNRYSGK